jgi:hypothetical protein
MQCNATGSRGVSRSADGQCSCVCRNFYTGPKCGFCAPYFVDDCSRCDAGFAANVDSDSGRALGCQCERHIDVQVSLPGPKPNTMQAIAHAAVVDLRAIVRNAGCTPTTGDDAVDMVPLVYKISKTSTTPDGKTSRDPVYTVKYDALLRARSTLCEPVQAAALCVKAEMAKRVTCSSFPNLVAALGGNVGNCSEAAFFVAPVIISTQSSCAGTDATKEDGGKMCAAASDIDDSNFNAASTTAAPDEDDDDKAPVGLIVGIIAGVLALIVAALLVRRYVRIGKSSRKVDIHGDDTGRGNMHFHLRPDEDEVLIPDAENYIDDDGGEGDDWQQVKRNRVNTQFLMDDMMGQNKRTAAKAATATAASATSAASPPSSKARPTSALDEMLSPKEGADSSMYDDLEVKPRNKRAITMTFI